MSYIESIEKDLALFKNKTLLTKEYKKLLEEWYVRFLNGASGFVGGPTFEMDRVLSINQQKKVSNYKDKRIETTKITCPRNRKIEIVLKHQSIIDLPIPDVLIKLFKYRMVLSNVEVASKKTNKDGRAIFTDLELGESYLAEAIDNNLVENNKALFRAYDDLMLEMYYSLNKLWQEYKVKWQKEINIVELIKKFVQGLYNGHLFLLID